MDIFAAALPGCPRLGAKHMRALIEAFGTAEDVWKASDKEIVESHLLKGKTEASFLAYRKETEPEENRGKVIPAADSLRDMGG